MNSNSDSSFRVFCRHLRPWSKSSRTRLNFANFSLDNINLFQSCGKQSGIEGNKSIDIAFAPPPSKGSFPFIAFAPCNKRQRGRAENQSAFRAIFSVYFSSSNLRFHVCGAAYIRATPFLFFLSPFEDLANEFQKQGETSKFFLGPGCPTFADHGLSFNLQRGKKSFRGSFRDLSSGGLREGKKKGKKGGTKRYKEGRVEQSFLLLLFLLFSRGCLGARSPLDIFITAERSYCLSKPRSSPTIIGTKLFAFLLRLLGIGLAQFPTITCPSRLESSSSSRIR